MVEIRLNELLKKRGINANDLGKLGVIESRTAYKITENPYSMPRKQTITSLCRYFGVKPSELIRVRDDLLEL